MDSRLPARRRRPLRRGAYILPSLFTMGNILLGFYAVVLAHRGDFERAPWMIVLAGVLDGLDGRIARLTHTESEFGKELDSLADVLTFGAAPAYLTYLWGLHEHGRVGWLIPLLFLLCTAIRLARFNVQVRTVDSRSFVGLPSPAAAAAIMALLFLDTQLLDTRQNTQLAVGSGSGGGFDLWEQVRDPAMALALVLVGSLMISTFRYPSFKQIDLRQRWSYRMAAAMAVLLLLILSKPVISFQIVAAVFALAGPALWIFGRFRRRLGLQSGTSSAGSATTTPDDPTPTLS